MSRLNNARFRRVGGDGVPGRGGNEIAQVAGVYAEVAALINYF